jgi:MoxR-like ATPase
MLSDRRVVRAQRLVAAAAILDGRDSSTSADMWVLPLIAPTADAQALARETLTDLLAKSENMSILHAAEEYSRGPLARAGRLAETARAVLGNLGEGPAGRDAMLRVEATLREIDAAFAAADLPSFLAELRGQLIAASQGRVMAAEA